MCPCSFPVKFAFSVNLQLSIKFNKGHSTEWEVSYELVFNFYNKSSDGMSLFEDQCFRIYTKLCFYLKRETNSTSKILKSYLLSMIPYPLSSMQWNTNQWQLKLSAEFMKHIWFKPFVNFMKVSNIKSVLNLILIHCEQCVLIQHDQTNFISTP